MKKIKVKTNQKNYSIYVGENILNSINKILKKESITFNKYFIIYDSKINYKIVEKIIRSFKNKEFYEYKFISKEKNKNFKNVNRILRKLLKFNFNRQDVIISVGGGIIGDVSGFTASIFKRGIKFVNIPTTLLAQVDSSIGGKTGINDNLFGKNLIGTFYQPDLVISDTNLLKTLTNKDIICGYAEILKHSLILDKKFFNYLSKFYNKIIELKNPYLQNSIIRSCKIKIYVVEKDEKENQFRKILNLGHTFGHAYEAASNYEKNLNHGEGVLLGIKSSVMFSYKKRILTREVHDRIINHINNLNLNLKLRYFFNFKSIEKFLKFMSNDKKNISKGINLILLKNIGSVNISNNFKTTEIRNFFKKELINI